MPVRTDRAVAAVTGWAGRVKPVNLAVLAVVIATVAAGTVAAASQSALGELSKQPLFAGYEVHGTDFQGASAQFTVPTFTCHTTSTSKNNDVFYQVALGARDFPEEEVYAGGYCNSTTPVYEAGYVFGAGEGGATLAVNAGDMLAASLSYNATTNQYTFSLQDTTAGTSLTATKSCPSHFTCGNTNAMIVAGVWGLAATAPATHLTNYKKVLFTNVTVTDAAGTTSGLLSSQWTTTRYLETTMFQGGSTVASSSSLGTAGNAFSDTWVAP